MESSGWTVATTLAALLACATGASVASAQNGDQRQQGALPDYQIQPGDRLEISVWREEDLNQSVLVRPDGGISFPLVGDLSTVGMTVEQVRREIAAHISRYIPDPVVTVIVSEINGNKIYVIGQVNNPGEFVVNPRVDVMQALSLAGGLTAFASAEDIFVLRRSNGRQESLPFRFGQVARGRNLEQNIVLQSGDVVVVP